MKTTLNFRSISLQTPISKAKTEGRYRGSVADVQKHELIRTLRLAHGKSLRETARLAGVSKMTVIRFCN